MTTSNPTETSKPLLQRVWESPVLANGRGILIHRLECLGSSDATTPAQRDFRVIVRPATVMTLEKCLTVEELAAYADVVLRGSYTDGGEAVRQIPKRMLDLYKAEYEPQYLLAGEPMGLVVRWEPNSERLAQFRAAADQTARGAGKSTRRRGRYPKS